MCRDFELTVWHAIVIQQFRIETTEEENVTLSYLDTILISPAEICKNLSAREGRYSMMAPLNKHESISL